MPRHLDKGEVMVSEQRYAWGRAYRDEQLVCARVHVTIGCDDRLGLARHERRYVVARVSGAFECRLYGELRELVRRRGAGGRRVAEALAPIELVVDDPHRGRQRVIGYLQPPQSRHGELREIEFALRELAP